MIVIESKRKKIENILMKYPGAHIHDVTSHANDTFVQLSPFYPHGGIPVPFTPGMKAMSVESVWQGLKDFELYGIDTSVFRNNTMKDLKRTVRKYGKVRGHRKGVYGSEHLDYLTARKEIYLPTYFWMLANKAVYMVERIRQESKEGTVVLLDYNTNTDIDDTSSPLSHAGLIKAYIENAYPEYMGNAGQGTASEIGFQVGDKVLHPSFGTGTVKEIQQDLSRIIVDFGARGTKTLFSQMANLVGIED